MPTSRVDVEQQARLDGVARAERDALEQLAARRHLARQRLVHARELRIERLQQRPRGELGDAPAAGRRDAGRGLERAAEEALDELRARLAHERAEHAAGEALVEVLGVGVDEAHDVAGQHRQRAPHRVALADRGPELGHQRVLVVHLGAERGGDRRRAVGRRRVDDDDLIDRRRPRAARRAARRRRRSSRPPRGRARRPRSTPRARRADDRPETPSGGGCARSRRSYYLKRLVRGSRHPALERAARRRTRRRAARARGLRGRARGGHDAAAGHAAPEAARGAARRAGSPRSTATRPTRSRPRGQGRRSSRPAPRRASRCASTCRRSTSCAATRRRARCTSIRRRRCRRTRRARSTRSG